MNIFGDDSSAESLEIYKLRALVDAALKGDWIEFEDYFYRELGHSPVRGRPNMKLLAESIVGKSGYTTLSAFLKHEMGVGQSKKKTMNFAYKLVLEHEYLRLIKPEPKLIKKVALHCGKGMFPDTESGFVSTLQEINTQKESQRSRNLSAAEKRNNFLQDELQKAEIRNQQLLSEVHSCQESKKHLEEELTAKDKELENCREIAQLYKRVISELISHSTLLQKPIKTLYLLHDTEKELSTWKLLTRPPLDHANELKDIGKQFESIQKKMINTIQRGKKVKLEKAA